MWQSHTSIVEAGLAPAIILVLGTTYELGTALKVVLEKSVVDTDVEMVDEQEATNFTNVKLIIYNLKEYIDIEKVQQIRDRFYSRILLVSEKLLFDDINKLFQAGVSGFLHTDSLMDECVLAVRRILEGGIYISHIPDYSKQNNHLLSQVFNPLKHGELYSVATSLSKYMSLLSVTHSSCYSSNLLISELLKTQCQEKQNSMLMYWPAGQIGVTTSQEEASKPYFELNDPAHMRSLQEEDLAQVLPSKQNEPEFSDKLEERLDEYEIKIADFSVFPGPMYRKSGEDSAEEFREDILEPHFKEALKRGVKLKVDLDGTYGYSSEFLHGVFGELARKYSYEKVNQHLHLKSNHEPYLLDEIYKFMKENA